MTTRTRIRATLTFVLALAAAPAVWTPALAQDAAGTERAARRTLTIEDQFAIKQVGSPVISPDGEWVAYTVRSTDLPEDRSETRLFMMRAAGGEPIPMTAPGYSAGSPAWSPDGKYLSFTASRGEERTQVWAFNRLGGDAQPLTDVRQGVNGYAWSPDGKRLALVIRDPAPGDTAGRAGGRGSAPREPWVIDRLQFKRDGIGYLDRRRTHIYVFDLETKTLTRLTSGDYDHSSPAWSPDGRRIAFVANRTEEPDANSNTDIWIVAADATDQGATLLQVTSNPGADRSPAWSPDGRSITYVTVIEPDIIWYATNHLAVSPAEGGEPRLLTRALDRNVSNPRFSTDGRSIFFVLEDGGERHLARIPAAGGDVARPISGARSVRGYDLGPDGRIAALISEPHLPGEAFMLERNGLRRLTRVNDEFLSGIRLAEMRPIRFNSADGTPIGGFVHFPPGHDPAMRYPTLLRIHGGPVSQYEAAFNFEAQLFSAHGYVVVMTNPRGSSGYGQAFSHAIWADWGNKDFQDVMAGVDHAIQQGWADPDRLGVGGWSYGGILTNYVITQTDRFKAAITGASEVLYIANYGHDHYQHQWEKELGLPWESRENWERISPFNRVQNIVTPTLIMGGEVDWNVPVQNSEQLYQALRRLGRETQLVVYPGQAHGITRPSFQKDRWERYLAWYAKHVKGEGVRADR